MKTLHTIYSTFAKHNMAKFLTVLTILFTVGIGQMWGAEKTITLTYSDFGLTTSYVQKTATVDGIGFTVNQGYKGSGNVIQMNSSKGKGVLYNTTSIPGLKSITVNVSSGSKTYTITSGTAQTPSGNSQTGTTTKTFSIPSGDTYFQLKVSGASYFSSIVITYDDGNSGSGSDGCTWQLVTDASNLVAGNRIVIAAAGYDYAMGDNSSNGEYRIRTAITKNENKIAITNDVQIIILEEGTKTNTFAFNVDDSYLYAASSTKNYLKTTTTLDDEGSWSITIANDGVATIKAQGDNTRNWIRYNANSSQERFSCYGSGQNNVVIYKEICAKEVTVTLDPAGGTGIFTDWIEDGDNYTMTVDADTEITLPELSKTGYDFDGWHDGKETVTSPYTPTTDITLTAQWTAKALTNYRTFCDVVCDAYSFHTGSDDDREEWLKEAIKCFTKAEGGYEHEWQIKDYIIPNDDDKFFVGNYGYFYNDNLGIGGENGKSRSVVSDWGNMYLAPAMDENDAPGTPRLGHAKGAKGTLRIFDDSNWDNLYVGFIPDGYKLKFGNEEYTFAMHNEGDREYRSEAVVEYNSTNADKNVSVGVVDADGNYVATNHTQEMRHIFLDVSKQLDGGSWADANAKFAIYYWNNSTNGWCGFLKNVPSETTLYEGWVPADATGFKFVRYNSNQSAPGSWDNDKAWNQTGDLTFQQVQENGNLFTITDWGAGTWSTYEKYGQFAMHDNSKSKNWYVHFVPHYVLTYDENADDAIGEMDVQTVAVDADDKGVVVADCGFTRPGYRFIKWRKGTTSTYYVPNGSNTIELNADITLYAQWEKEYTVTYDANDGTTSCVDDNAYIKGETVTVCDEVPTKTGYTFDGWVRSDNGEKVKEGESFTMPANDVTLTAQWIINKYTVTLNPNYPAGKTGTFIDNNGNTVNQVQLTYDYNTASMSLTDLYQSIELEGYQFNGWYSATSGGSKWTSTGTITKNVTVYAQWTKVYSVILSENGTTKELEPQTSTSYELPDDLSVGSCDNDEKELVGWSTVAIPTPGDKPSSNFYELGETVTLTADQTTFYAVFATPGEGGVDNTDYSNVHTSNVTLTNAGGTNATNSKVKISEVDYTAVKAGTGSASGAVKITVPAGTTKLSFHMAGWNGEGGKTISLSGATADPSSFKTVADAGVSGSSTTYTLSGTIADYFYSTTLSNIDAETTLTFSNGGADQRFVIWGVNASTGGAVSYSEYTTACVKLPDPVLSFETEPANPIVFTDAVCGGNSSKQSVTVVGENLRDVVNVSVTGPYKIARTASTALKDFTTSLTLDKTAAGAIHSNYQTVYIISTPPAQSTEATTGTLTFTTTKGNTLTVNLSTPTVTCAQYTLTLVDRGVSTEQPTKYYAGETINEAPADPEGVCTDPIHYVFDGWATSTVAGGSTTYTKVTFPYTVTGNTKFYAVYRYVEEGSGDGDYHLVEEELTDYSGDYLIVSYDNNYAMSTSGEDKIGTNTYAGFEDISEYYSNKVITSNATTDTYVFTAAKTTNGYSLHCQQNDTYLGILNTSTGTGTVLRYYDEEDYNDKLSECEWTIGVGSISNYAHSSYNQYIRWNENPKRFAIYGPTAVKDIHLYKKADGTTYYTTSPICGPYVEITSDKDIYVTGGVGTGVDGTRSTVVAQQKVQFSATRLEPNNSGNPPSIKVPAADITIDGSATTVVSVNITQDLSLQGDGTYAGTGEITVTYTPTSTNVMEDINVQLRAEYNTGDDATLDNFTVHARSLPEEFVIVAKQGDKWYALNADMSSSKAQPANGQITLDDATDPTKATYAPCNTIYTFDGVQNTGDRTYVRFVGLDGKYLRAAAEGNTGIQNYSTAPAGDAIAYDWKLYTTDNETYRLANGTNTRNLGLNTNLNFGMYAPVTGLVNDIRILPYEAKCIYNYAPSNITIAELKSTSVTLAWDPVQGATKYQYSTDATNWTDAGSEPNVTINGLTPSAYYTYYIRAYHEDAGVTQECIDYAEISFATANCDDVPTDITYSSDLTTITVTWTAQAATSTVKLYSDEEATTTVQTQENADGSVTFTDLTKNTQYYVQVFADGTCASPIVPVRTEDVEVDIVEWDPQGIIVDINTDETIGVTLENEVSYGSGLGSLAEDLFFSKYFEGSGSLKMIAIYNGTGKDVDLTDYFIYKGHNGSADFDEDDQDKILYPLSELGVIKQGQEIVLYSWPLNTDAEASVYSCSQTFLHSIANESGQDANPRWILCGKDPTNSITPIYSDAMNFNGDDPLLLYKDGEIIDVFGATAGESPENNVICDGYNENEDHKTRSDESWVANDVSNMDYGKTAEDFPNGEIPDDVNVDDPNITAYTARVIMFRKNSVTSGANAVTKNTDDFHTFAEEWEVRQVCRISGDGDLTCAAYQELGTFDYSDYYTKYEPMGEGTTFDENARNADGTVTIPITDLYKHACSNIRVKLTNSNGDVLTDREYKVPIMITTTQGTDGQTFLDLQQNLATKEVDGEGNVIATHPLSLEEVREICKTCDVVVRDNATLTKVTDGTTNDHPQVHDVIVYEGASIIIPDGDDYNYTINSFSLRRKGDEVASAQVQGTGKLVLPADAPIYLDMRVNAENWHWFTLPYDCDIADVTWSDGTPAKYNTDWFLMYYDGESRANEQSHYENHWKYVPAGSTIEAGKGYIIGIQGNLTHPLYTFELRFPMAAKVLTNENTDKSVPLYAWGVDMDITPNKKGWNLVGNPYLNYYQTSDVISFEGLALNKYKYNEVTGEQDIVGVSDAPFLVLPVDGGWYEYKQELASDVEMQPFTSYFVQIGDPEKDTHGTEYTAKFSPDKRGRMSLIRRAPQEVDNKREPVIVRVELSNAKGEMDKTTLIIDDQFTNEYEMNADFFKWFGDYYRSYTKPVLYSMGGDQGKRAFNALSEQLAAQPVALGMFAAQAGDYTFSLTRKRCDLSRVEEVWLYDATTATYTNLMQQDYTFTTAKTEGEGRFYLSVKMKQKTPTAVENVNGNLILVANNQTLTLSGLPSEAQVWVYDATGKLLHSEHTTAYQRNYQVPQAGVYFVSVKGQGKTQTLSTIVK